MILVRSNPVWKYRSAPEKSAQKADPNSLLYSTESKKTWNLPLNKYYQLLRSTRSNHATNSDRIYSPYIGINGCTNIYCNALLKQCILSNGKGALNWKTTVVQKILSKMTKTSRLYIAYWKVVGIITETKNRFHIPWKSFPNL
jgi:hypothetical protein